MSSTSAFVARLARWRVPLGFVCGVVSIGLAAPTWRSWLAGLAVAITGELIRLWAAGHLEKNRGITRSGPYRFVRHPLYLGSALLAAGFGVASRSAIVIVLAAVYVVTTFAAAIRTEERALDRAFGGAYTEYRAGRGAAVARAFSWARVVANREYRAALGLAAVFALLVFRMR